MASKQSNVDFVLEQMADAGPLSARKMFGEYAFYCEGKVVALFCDDTLFIKPTDTGRAFIGDAQEGAPYPGAKPWFVIAGDLWEDGDWLSRLVRLTADALPIPKPKPLKRKAAAKKAPAKKALPNKRAPAKKTPAKKTLAKKTPAKKTKAAARGKR